MTIEKREHSGEHGKDAILHPASRTIPKTVNVKCRQSASRSTPTSDFDPESALHPELSVLRFCQNATLSFTDFRYGHGHTQVVAAFAP